MKMAAELFGITVREGIEGRSLNQHTVEQVCGPLKTTVFLFEGDDGLRVCLITSHYLTHFYRFSNLFRKRVAEALDLPFEQVLSFSSHNHCAVKMVHNQYGFGRAERDLWLEEKDLTDEGLELLQRCVEGGLDALEDQAHQSARIWNTVPKDTGAAIIELALSLR